MHSVILRQPMLLLLKHIHLFQAVLVVGQVLAVLEGA
jgi:hypothetical protein